MIASDDNSKPNADDIIKICASRLSILVNNIIFFYFIYYSL